MDHKSNPLSREDGRFYAIGKLGQGTASIATSEKLNEQIVSFGLPSPSALFLNIASSAFKKIKSINPIDLFDKHPHPQGIYPENHKSLFDFFENSITHIVFSYSALESLANDAIKNQAPENFTYSKKVRSEIKIYKKEEIEKEINLDEKLGNILPKIYNLSSPKGIYQLWQKKYIKLQKLRNRIVHLKSQDYKQTGPEDQTLWGDILRSHGIPFCDNAHEIIAYFEPIKQKRWHKMYPYDGSL